MNNQQKVQFDLNAIKQLHEIGQRSNYTSVNDAGNKILKYFTTLI
jgi:hypothetical protein